MKRLKLPIIAALLAVLPFLAGINGAFLTEWDDGGFITQNADLVPDWVHIKKIAASNLQTVYTPLTTLSLLLDRTVFGLQPTGYHLHNLLLFALCTAALYLIARKLALKPAIALAVTLGWAWNPAKAESVVWISERKTLLASALLGWSVLRMLRSYHRHRHSLTGPFAAALAPLAKATALTGCVIPLLYGTARRPKQAKRNFRFALPYLAGGAAAAILVTVKTFGELSGNQKSSPFSMILSALRYLGETFLPFGLNPIHPVNETPLIPILSGILIGVLLAAMIRRTGIPKLYWISFGAAWLLFLLPVLASRAFTNADFADRYNFLPSAILWLFAGVLFQKISKKLPLNLKKIFPLYLIIIALAAFSYTKVFCDSAALFSAACSHPKPNLKAAEGLMLVGLNREDSKLLEAAAEAFIGSKKPGSDKMALICLGKASHLEGQYHNTLSLLDFLQKSPLPSIYGPEIHYSAAFSAAIDSALKTGDKATAVKLIENQLNSQAGSPFDLRFNAGLKAFLENDRSKAVEEWQKALEIRPADQRLKANLERLEASKSL